MQRLVFLLPPLLLVGLLALGGGSARAASSAPKGAHTSARPTLLLAPTTHRASGNPCDAGNDPQTCANALTGGIDRFFQVVVLVLIEVGGGIGILALIYLAIRGMAGVAAGEPRAVAYFVFHGTCIVILLFCMVGAPWLLPTILHGIKLQLPSIQQLIGS